MTNKRTHTIAFDRAQISGVSSDIPVLLTRANFADELFDPLSDYRSDGADQRFFDEAGDPIAHELVSFALDSGSGAADGEIEAHVLAPLLDAGAGADPLVRVEYGDRDLPPLAVDDPHGRNAVWSNGFAAVYHLGEAGTGVAGEYVDSTGNGYDGRGGGGTGSQVPTQATGKVGGAQSFDRDDSQYIDCGTAMNLANSSFSVEAWANLDDYPPTTSNATIVAKYFGSVPRPFALYNFPQTASIKTTWFQYNLNVAAQSDTSQPLDAWTQYTGVYDAAADTLKLFVDSELQADDETGVTTITSDNRPLLIGAKADNAPTLFWDGLIDEVRISTVARSTDWIATTHANQHDPAAFATAGAPWSISYDPSPAAIVVQGLPLTVSVHPPDGTLAITAISEALAWSAAISEALAWSAEASEAPATIIEITEEGDPYG